jgi:hypothetical protein
MRAFFLTAALTGALGRSLISTVIPDDAKRRSEISRFPDVRLHI